MDQGFSDNKIWSDDVEQAFQEVLKIIPKSGLNKLKIAGRTCGRNELISDYILFKTGKYRSRKQISSHIQVIKNIGINGEIINLINEGPVCYGPEKDALIKNFEDVFTTISLNKAVYEYQSPSTQATAKRFRKSSTFITSNDIKLSNFYMTINDHTLSNPIVLTVQENGDLESYELNDDANISFRFPGLNEFKGCSVTIIHNMVNILMPILPPNYDLNYGFRSTYSLEYNETPHRGKKYKSFTAVYIYGVQQLSIDEDNVYFNRDREFLIKFWRFFFANVMNSSEEEQISTIKGLTIKQIIYEANETYTISKSSVKLVLLWEFAKSLFEARTISRKLILSSSTSVQPPMVKDVSGPLDQEALQEKFRVLRNSI